LAKYSKILNIEKQDVDFQEYYDAIYSEVYSKCGMDPRVTIHRMTSDEWFATKPEKLDWIYVDGDHSYEGCLRDLENSLKVVKPGGMIMGDDYYWKHARYGKEGVTNAVDRFCKRYMLFKEPRGETQFILRV
jgi:predicted O-methyltransferase YrrM